MRRFAGGEAETEIVAANRFDGTALRRVQRLPAFQIDEQFQKPGLLVPSGKIIVSRFLVKFERAVRRRNRITRGIDLAGL